MKEELLDDKIKKFKNLIVSKNYSFKTNFNLKFETYFKMGGIAQIFCTPNSITEFVDIVTTLRYLNLDFKIIGFTSNIILIDQIEYTIIISTKNLTNLNSTETYLEVETGYSLIDFVRVASILFKSKGYEGLEGIPGSIGGGILMNAGAYGYSIADNIISVTILGQNNEILELSNNECNFEYRNSIFKANRSLIILKAKFAIIPGSSKQITENIERYHIARHSYQEFSYPNLGSLFSIKGDIYLEILKKYKYGSFQFHIFKLIYKNPITKLLKRKRPDNLIFTDLLVRRIGKNRHTISRKGVNILVNDGTCDLDQILDYIDWLKKDLKSNVSIENEFVLQPTYKIEEAFTPTYNRIVNYFNVII